MYVPHYKHKSNNVPIISKADIDFFAENFISDFQPEALTIPMEFNIDMFIESYLELTFDYQYLSSDQRYLGMTVFNDTSRVIVFNPDMNQADYLSAKAGTIIIDNTLLQENKAHRYRFTAAHESGHWIFHRPYYNYDQNQLSIFEMDVPYIQCRDINKDYNSSRDTRYWDDKKWMEWQADKFASSILMPKKSILLFVRDKKAFSSEELVLGVSYVYNVSLEAAKYRLMDLGIIKSNLKNEYEQLSLF